MISLLLAFPWPALAQNSPSAVQSIELTPATTQAILAEPLEVKAVARFDPGYELSLDTSAQDTEPFAVVGSRRLSAEQKDGQRMETWDLTLLPLALGATAFPTLEWRLGGRGERTIKSPPIPLEIVPPASVAEHPDILELRPPWAPASQWAWFAALAALLLIAAGLAVWRSRRRTVQEAAKKAPPLSPEEEANKALEELLAGGLWERGEIKAFYDRLSQIARRFISRRFEIDASYLTTGDLARRMRKAGVSSALIHPAKDMLESCDLAKFARSRPGEAERDKDIRRAKDLFAPPAPKPIEPAGQGVKPR